MGFRFQGVGFRGLHGALYVVFESTVGDFGKV